MRSFFLSLFCVLVVSVWVKGQNIPHANVTGPYGVQVNTFNGNLHVQHLALSLPNTGLSLELQFAYNSFRDTVQLGCGKGFSFNYQMYYEADASNTGYYLHYPDGRTVFFQAAGNAYEAPAGTFDTWEEAVPGQFVLTTKYGIRYSFENAVHRRLTQIEDTNGNTIEIDYTAGLPTTITDQSGRFVSLIWEGMLLQSIEDGNFTEPREMLFQYDSEGHLLQFTDPLGESIHYSYSGDQLINIINKRGDFLDLFYDQNGRVHELISCISKFIFQYNNQTHRTFVIEKNSDGDRLTTFVYDEDGHLLERKGSCCGYGTSTTYDTDLNIDKRTDADDQVYTANHDARGNAVVLMDPLGGEEQFEFGDLNRLSNYTDPNGVNTAFQYDGNGNLTAVQQSGTNLLLLNYDSDGNLVLIQDANDHQTTFSYNANNDPVSVEFQEPGTGDSYQYDNVGNLTQITDGNNNAVQLEYDKLNRIVQIADDLGNFIQLEYDPASNVTSEQDAAGTLRTFEYDPHNRLERVNTPSGETAYQYDASGNLTGILDANLHQRTFKYDHRNLLVEEIDPLGQSTHYSYDANGNRIFEKTPNGSVIEYEYDAMNRLIKRSYPDNTDYYDYDANGNLLYCANDDIAISYSYDGFNRLVAKEILTWNISLNYEYDAAGNRIKMIDPTGETTYMYDGNNRLTMLSNPAGQVTLFSYDNGGRLVEQVRANSTSTSYTYDATDHITEIQHYNGNGTLFAGYSYEYDQNSNVTKVTRADGLFFDYTIDEDNRLERTYKNGALSENYVLDPVGNRLTFNLTNYSYDAADQLLSAGDHAYTYDANGNLKAKTQAGETTYFAYDGLDRLVEVVLPDGTEVHFAYDPLGTRIAKSVGTTAIRYVLDGENLLLELDQSNSPQKRYTSALALDYWISMESGGQTYFYHADGINTTRHLTDLNQIVQQTYDYDSYGQPTQNTGTVDNHFTYTGREWDAETGLYFYRSRYYDPQIGRFLTRDNYEGVLSRPLSFNAYNYVEGNPISRIDPNGQWFLQAVGGLLNAGMTFATKYEKYDGNLDCFTAVDFLDIGKDFVLGALSPSKGALVVVGAKRIKQAKDLERSIPYLQRRRAEVNAIRKDVPALRNPYQSERVLRQRVDKKIDQGVSTIKKGAKDFLGDIKKGVDYIDARLTDADPCGGDNAGGAQEEKKPGTQEDPPAEDPGDPGTEGNIKLPIIGSMDPNLIVAPIGYELQKWVARDARLPYTIFFENDPDFATAPAQRVRIEHKFDADLNRFSFRLGNFGFGNYYFTVPEDVSYYNTQIDLSDSLGVLLQVTAGLNAADTSAFWVFESIDPATGLAATLPATAGFLPVNDSLLHNGEGFVNFSIQPAAGVLTGTLIDARADIYFDNNAVIPTNTDFNTVDADAPLTEILEADGSNGSYNLSWTGTDIVNGLAGAGLAYYTLYGSTDNGPFLPLVDQITETDYTFDGDPQKDYCFFVLGTDFVDQTEALKDACEPACMDVLVTQVIGSNGSANNGLITLEVSGASGLLNYQWSHDNSLNSNLVTGLAPGNYTVTITDETDCEVILTITVENLDAVQEPTGLFIYSLFPSPTSGKVQIEWSSPEKVLFLEVFNAQGQQVYRRTLESSPYRLEQYELDAGAWPAGNYLVHLRSRTDQIAAVFIKQ